MRPYSIKLEERLDNRGALHFLELTEVPFEIRRLFNINVTDLSHQRGGHAHKKCWQLMLSLDSDVSVYINDSSESEAITLSPGYGLVIPPLNWITITFTVSHSSLLVLASHKFDENDYIRNKSEFEKLIAERE